MAPGCVFTLVGSVMGRRTALMEAMRDPVTPSTVMLAISSVLGERSVWPLTMYVMETKVRAALILF